MCLKLISTLGLLLSLTACQYMPEMFRAVDDMATDEAVEMTIYREAIKKDVNLKIEVATVESAK